MASTNLARNSVLGKRTHQQLDGPSTAAAASCDQIHSPNSTPAAKRARTSLGVVDGDANKENVPPLTPEASAGTPRSPRRVRSHRSLRRTTTGCATPSRTGRNELRRCASTIATPSSILATPACEISFPKVATPPPTPPTSLLPLHARARTLLNSTCTEALCEITGRDTERATIIDFIASFLSGSATEADGVCFTTLYISGSPGTGKTALVNSVLPTTSAHVKVVPVNCITLDTVDALWEQLLEDFGEVQKSETQNKTKGRDAVEGVLAQSDSKWIILLDKLNHIAPTAQSLATLFSFQGVTTSMLRVIGIADTRTLSSSSLTSVIATSRNVQTLHFAPYTPAQLTDILQARLKPLSEGSDDKAAAAEQFLPLSALTFLAEKIAATTGDVRSLFSVLRDAIDLAVTVASSTVKDENPLDTPVPVVTPTHVLTAIKASATPSINQVATSSSHLPPGPAIHSTNEIVAKVTNLGSQAQLVLLSILCAFQRLEAGLLLTMSPSSTPSKKSLTSPMKLSSTLPSSNTTAVCFDLDQLHAYYAGVLDRSDRGVFEHVSRNGFYDLIGLIEGNGLISLQDVSDISETPRASRTLGRPAAFAGTPSSDFNSKGKGSMRIAKGVKTEDILQGLGISMSGDAPSPVHVRQEALVSIWTAEKTRLGAELIAIQRGKERTTLTTDTFQPASEG